MLSPETKLLLRAEAAEGSILFGIHVLKRIQAQGTTESKFSDLCAVAATVIREHPKKAERLLAALAALDMADDLDPRRN